MAALVRRALLTVTPGGCQNATLALARSAMRPASTSAQQALAPPKANRGKNVYELATMLPSNGVGVRMVRKEWLKKGYSDSYWTIDRVVLEADPRRGKAWGRLTWRGKADVDSGKIRGASKRDWRYLVDP